MWQYLVSFLAGVLICVLFIKCREIYVARKGGYVRLKEMSSHSSPAEKELQKREDIKTGTETKKSKFDVLFNYGSYEKSGEPQIKNEMFRREMQQEVPRQTIGEPQIKNEMFSSEVPREVPRHDNIINNELDNKFIDLSHLAQLDAEKHRRGEIQDTEKEEKKTEWTPMGFFEDE